MRNTVKRSCFRLKFHTLRIVLISLLKGFEVILASSFENRYGISNRKYDKGKQNEILIETVHINTETLEMSSWWHSISTFWYNLLHFI